MGRGDGSQYLVHCLHSSLRYRLGMRIRFEYCQGTLSAGISKDLVELRKKHHHQGLDLVLIAGSLFARDWVCKRTSSRYVATCSPGI